MLKFVFALLSLFVLTIPINAQVTDRKFEVGGFFTSITLDDFKDRVSPGFATGDSTVNGIGGRLTRLSVSMWGTRWFGSRIEL